MMSRRGMLGFAAGAAVAGPSVARDAMANAAGTLRSFSGAPVPIEAVDAAFGYPTPGGGTEKSNYAFEELERLIRNKPKAFSDGFPSAHDLDPDIADMRSISASAKLRMQAERNAERRHLNDIEQWLETIGGERYLSPELRGLLHGILGRRG